MADHVPVDEAAVGNDEAVAAEIVEEPTGEPDLPDDAAEAVPILMERLAAARHESAELLDTLQRRQAELENLRKRALRDAEEVRAYASLRLVESMLPVLDSYDVAFSHEPQTPTEEKLVAGMRNTYALLFDLLRKEGLEPIPADGEAFDPVHHEAVTAPPDGEGTLIVTQELRRGYRFGSRVIRPSLVAVDYA